MTNEERILKLQFIEKCLSLVLGRVQHIKSALHDEMLTNIRDAKDITKAVDEAMATELKTLTMYLELASGAVLQCGQDD